MKYKNPLSTFGAGALACAVLLSMSSAVFGAVTLTANGSSDTYALIASSGFGNENPDCVHGSFGQHVTQTLDSTLGKHVFVFHSHINADNDRCVNFDRVRMEIKGGAGTPSEMQHVSGQTAYYRWKFRLASDFIGSSSFTHIFQIKAFGGDEGAPLITITPRATTLQVIHSSGGGSGSQGTLAQVSLAPFKGAWVEAFVKYKSSEGSAGTFEITLKRMSDGATLLSFTDNTIDMWRTGASFNRGKWGVYRSKDTTKKDEQVRFADFCISESSASSCPSSIGGGGGGIDTTAIYQIQNVASSLVLNQQGSLTNGSPITQWSSASTSQNLQWKFIPTSGGYYQINSVKSGRDAVVQNASTASGAKIIQWSFGSAGNDQWQPVQNSDSTWTFFNLHSGLVLANPGGSTSTSTQMVQETSNGGSNQKWRLLKQ